MPAARKQWERPKILSDLPLREKDKAHFHFDEFAATLALLISDPSTRTPLTIGISGPWGSGKTTLLQRVKTLLETRDSKGLPFFASPGEKAQDFRTCKTVWFDAWKYNDEDELLVALVRVILAAMKQGGLIQRLRAEWEDPQQPKYDLINMFLSAFQLKFGGLGAEVQVQLDPQKFEKESPFTTHTAFFDYFNEAFERLLALWVHGMGDYQKIDEQKGALVVFIDDLDRCLPEKTVQVLEAIKLFLDKPGCIYVLGAHVQMVEEAVKKHYAAAGMTDEYARDYLEKIIQIRLDLPPILEAQMGGFVEDLKSNHNFPPELLDDWQTLVAGAEFNPRKVKTFLNDIQLAWALLVNSGQAEGVERTDFTRWQVLMRAAPDAFKKPFYDIDDPDMRFEYLKRALQWAKGDGQAAEYFRDFENHVRLKRTLRKIGEFSPRFNARVLDAFIHLVAPSSVPSLGKSSVEPKQPEKSEKSTKTPSLEISEPLTGKEPPQSESTRGYREWGGLLFVPVPAGKFLMGSREDNPRADSNEFPRHSVEIPYLYWIGRYPVTNEQFAKFLEDTHQKHTWNYDWKEKANHPVVYVSWDDAQKYCSWLNQTFGNQLPAGHVFRLPTEAEWEKAARGEFGFEWPWGNEFDLERCNTSEGRIGDTTPVGKYSPAGDSPYGAADVAGNVWEWTQSLYKPYPYNPGDGREDLKSRDDRVLRGGSFYNDADRARCAYRGRYLPDYGHWNYGFRVVVAPREASPK